ncbi:hypothetical protein LPJ75_003874, partial [Coemansia sp. RSA 2598]
MEKAAALDAPSILYGYNDHQSTCVAESLLKPDLAIVCEREISETMDAIHMVVEAKVQPSPGSINDKDLGQILDYVQAVWKSQITCMFVPVLFLHGPSLSLLVFTRSKSIRVDLGKVFFSAKDPIPSNSYKPISSVLLSLYFLLTLSPGEFGHICDFTAYPTRLYFSPRISKIGAEVSQPTGSREQAESAGKSKQAESVLASVSSKYCDESTEFLLEHLFKREVGLHGRIAYVAKVTWDNQSAVLKLAWSATDRMPENAIYDILLESEVQRIPQLFSRGLLIEDFRGYRLEYIAMEDCGVPFSEALGMLKPSEEDAFVIYLKQIIEEVTACLVDASVAGVLHRDISDSNIA